MTTPVTPTAAARADIPNDLEAFWLPFTPNRAFKKRPRLIARSKDMHYYTPEGRAILDAHRRRCGAATPAITASRSSRRSSARRASSTSRRPSSSAIRWRSSSLRGSPQLAPADLDHVFFCNSGSEACDCALKIALAYHNVRGQGQRTRLIGRERAYHGVGFGGISVGGITNNRKFFGSLLAGVDHLPATYNREHQAFTKGEPEWGGHLADALEGIVALHDASTIAAVIVEPMSGSTGVLPPPKGYLQKLRQICDKYGILLIFDEVITGFGRLGHAFASERYGVVPDMITFAKGVTSGTVPMGGVIVRKSVYEAFMNGPEHAIELFHGYTYSGHPLACAAALATIDVYRDERLFERAKALEPKWYDAIMGLKGLPNVVDIRCVGLTGAIDLAPIAGSPTMRGLKVLDHSFHEAGIMLRLAGDTIELTPPLIVSEAQIDEIMEKTGGLDQSGGLSGRREISSPAKRMRSGEGDTEAQDSGLPRIPNLESGM